MCIATRDIMDCMFEAYIDGTLDPDDIPQTTEPVFILGKKYNAMQETNVIRQDITTKLWLTYRKNFVPIGGDDGLTSDRGWGCMLRCGQMVLAQALITVHLGRDWVWDPDTKDATYLKIVKRFEDKRQAPFSIHQIALMGVSEGRAVGQWFGPNTVAQVLKKLVKFDEWSSLVIHVSLDNTIIISDIKNSCLEVNDKCPIKYEWKPLLLVVPLRLGLTEFNPLYTEGIQKCFRFKQSLGVIGGKPNLALYFIGCVGNEVIYLDPHTTQRSGSLEDKESEEEILLDLTFHCKYASRMNITSMDPSVAVCFLCKTEQEFNELCQQIKDELVDPDGQHIFEVTYNKPKEYTFARDVDDAASASLSQALDSDHDFEIL